MPREPSPVPFAPRRVWTVDGANARLDSLRALLPGLREKVERLRRVHEEIHRLAGFWGSEIDAPDMPDRAHKDRLDAEWRQLTREIEGEVRSLRDDGIEVKDLDRGLVDFYGRVEGELAFLCWRLGEEQVVYYHSLTGGFRSRRAIPGRAVHAAADPTGSN